jgi:cysteinyl-tRNA synthetase
LLLQEKDFEEADAVRARLAEAGILIMDSPAGTTWRPGVRLVDA